MMETFSRPFASSIIIAALCANLGWCQEPETTPDRPEAGSTVENDESTAVPSNEETQDDSERGSENETPAGEATADSVTSDSTAEETDETEAVADEEAVDRTESETAASDDGASGESPENGESTSEQDIVADTTSAAATAEVSPETLANYQRVFDEWKRLLIQLVDLQNHYLRVAEDDELDSIKEEYDAKILLARTKAEELRQAAVAVYLEAPMANQPIVEFLYTLVQDDVQTERYQQAFDLAKTIIDNHAPDRAIYLMGSVAAIGAHEFELAKKWAAQSSLAADDDRNANPYVADLKKLVGEYSSMLEELALLWKEEQTIRAAEAAADDLPRVELQTTQGRIVLELFENEAPETVGNFIFLVEKKFYDGLPFHRVIQAFMAQTGCPRGDGTGDPGYSIYCECVKPNHRNHFTGSLSMAKGTPPDTGGSQFFLTFLPTPHLNGQHTVFGRVIEGLDVVQKIRKRDPAAEKDAGIIPDRIEKAVVLRKRDHLYVPNQVK